MKFLSNYRLIKIGSWLAMIALFSIFAIYTASWIFDVDRSLRDALVKLGYLLLQIGMFCYFAAIMTHVITEIEEKHKAESGTK
jgi:hypothetical protein